MLLQDEKESQYQEDDQDVDTSNNVSICLIACMWKFNCDAFTLLYSIIIIIGFNCIGN